MSQGHYARSDASSAGAALAAAREEMNLSISDVARHLKLTSAQIEALEEGAYERLPGRVFVRGFLRNYAKLLGVDPQPLLRRIEHEMPQPRVVEEPPPAQEAVMPTGERSRWPLFVGIIVIVIAALAAYEFGFNAPQALEGATEAAAPAAPPTPVEPAPVQPAPAAGAPAPAKPPAVAAAPVVPGAGGAPLDRAPPKGRPRARCAPASASSISGSSWNPGSRYATATTR